MTKPAPSVAEPEDREEPHATTPTSPLGSVAEPKPRRQRKNKSPPVRAASVGQRRDTALVAAAPATSPERTPRFKTLLLGAGIGAAVTLAIVAVRAKGSKGSPFAAAFVKATSYVLARTSARGSLINIVAHTVGRALS